jgi:hypothetical protein
VRTYNANGEVTNAPNRAVASIASINIPLTSHEKNLETDEVTKARFILAMHHASEAFKFNPDDLALVGDYNTSVTASSAVQLAEKLAKNKLAKDGAKDAMCTGSTTPSPWVRPDKGPHTWNIIAKKNFDAGELVLLPVVDKAQHIVFNAQGAGDRVVRTSYHNDKGHPMVITRPVSWALGKEFLPPFWVIMPTRPENVNMTMSEKTVSMAIHIANDSGGKQLETLQIRVPCLTNSKFIASGTLLGKDGTVLKAPKAAPAPRDWMSVKK